MTLEDLANDLHIEEELCMQDKSKKHVSMINMIEHGGSIQGQKIKQEEA